MSAGKCSLCHKSFKSKAAFEQHAQMVHKKKRAEFILVQPAGEREPDSAWEFYHLEKGWPI